MRYALDNLPQLKCYSICRHIEIFFIIHSSYGFNSYIAMWICCELWSYHKNHFCVTDKLHFIYEPRILQYILSLWGASCCVMYTYLFDVIIALCITTCFGPYGPSSSEYNILILFLNIFEKGYRYPNGSVVHKFVSYYMEGKYEVFYNGFSYQHISVIA
jgi:hypothetical protein